MISLFKVNMSPKAKDLVAQVLDSGMVGEGPVVKKYEDAISNLFDGHPNVIALNSCTSALTLALRMCNVEDGLVLASPFTFPATNCAIKAAGADIVWTNTDSTTCMDLIDAYRKLKEHKGKVKAVLITLVAGHIPHNLEWFLNMSREFRVPIIADAAHALMTYYKGHHISSIFDYCCFSTQSIKHLTTGDGGILTFQDPRDMDRARRLKWFGMARAPEGVSKLDHQMSYSIPEWGYKFHMNDINAAIGLANIEIALDAVKKSQENAEYYNKELSDIDHITLLKLPPETKSSWWVYMFRGTCSTYLIKYLNLNGIESSNLWKDNSQHACFPKLNQGFHNDIICIPSGFWVTEEDRKEIVDKIKYFYQKAKKNPQVVFNLSVLRER